MEGYQWTRNPGSNLTHSAILWWQRWQEESTKTPSKIGIDIHTLSVLCTKQKSNENLLYSRGNSINVQWWHKWEGNLEKSHHRFPGGSDSKESACNAGDPGLIPGLGRSLGEWNGYPLQYSCLENSMDSPWGGKKSDMTKQLTVCTVLGS